MASIEENNSIVEYVDGLCNSMYALFNEQLYVKSNKNYWNCRHKNCNVLIKIENDIANSVLSLKKKHSVSVLVYSFTSRVCAKWSN